MMARTAPAAAPANTFAAALPIGDVFMVRAVLAAVRVAFFAVVAFRATDFTPVRFALADLVERFALDFFVLLGFFVAFDAIRRSSSVCGAWRRSRWRPIVRSGAALAPVEQDTHQEDRSGGRRFRSTPTPEMELWSYEFTKLAITDRTARHRRASPA
jgi:hypothetical protein